MAKAKAKKRKVGESSTTPEIPESEDQTLVTPEARTEIPEDHHDDQVEPPKQNEPAGTEAMDAEANPADDLNLPSPDPALSPAKAAKDVPSHERNNDEITITGEAYKTP